jgi:hypothetical protein
VPSTWLSFKYTLGVDANDETRLQAIPKTSATFATGQIVSLQFNQTQIDHNLIGTATWAEQEPGGTVVLGQNLNARRFQREFAGNTLLNQPYKLTNTLSKERVGRRDAVHTEGYFGQSTFDANELYLTLGLRNDARRRSHDSRRN